MSHALKRTNKKGIAFIGRCIKCGEDDLPMEAVSLDCPMDDEVSDADALIEVLE